MAIATERAGQRVYVAGDTYALRARLKEAGCHWDQQRRQWWIGAAKAAVIEALVAELAGDTTTAPEPEDADDIRVIGKAAYKGRTYYIRAISQDGSRARLTTLDASLDFWAALGGAADQAAVVKRYEPRERTYGYGRHSRTEYTTLGSIRRFVERQRDPERARGRCTECDEWGPVGQTCSECYEGVHV